MRTVETFRAPRTCVKPGPLLGCWSNGKTPASRAGNRGSSPRRSTTYGLMVQWDDTSLACWKSGFNSRWVHWRNDAMRRWHEEIAIARGEDRRHLKWVHDWPSQPVDCVCDVQVGRFRKGRAIGCGRPRCYLCHGAKLLQEP